MNNTPRNYASVWSLAELLSVKAEHYIHIGRVFQYWMSRDDDLILAESDREAYNKALRELIESCDLLGLPVSLRLIRNTLDESKEAGGNLKSAARMGEIHRCIEAELQSSIYFLVPANRARYLAVYQDDEKTKLSMLGEELRRFAPVFV